jgi:hypothetical protein
MTKEPREVYGFAGYSGVAIPTFAKVNGMLSGSEKYRYDFEKGLQLKTEPEPAPPPKKNAIKCVDGGHHTWKLIKGDHVCKKCKLIKYRPAPRQYTLPKTKVSNKIHAFCQTAQSLKFLAFYSVTFPEGIEDGNAFKIWNIFLTRARQHYGLFNYIWVVERQKNDTIHYHLLTNRIMRVNRSEKDRAANPGGFSLQEAFNSILLRQRWKIKDKAIQRNDIVNLNGVDVARVWNFKGVRDYMQKKKILEYEKSETDKYLGQQIRRYITKNNVVFDHLTWHCSRLISSLFTKIILDPSDFARWLPFLEPAQTFEKFDYYRYRSDLPPPDNLFDIRIEANNGVVEKFPQHFVNLN